MRYPDTIIDEVRSRNDIVSVVGSYVKLKKAGSNYQGLCPFHSEKTPSFSVNPARQMYKCFGCGKAGNVFTFVMEYENFSFPEALQNLADRAGVALPKVEYSEQERRKHDLRANMLEVYKKSATYYYRCLRSDKGKYAREYLNNRRLSGETVQRFGLGYSDGGLYSYLKQDGYGDEFLSKCGLFTFKEAGGVHDKFFNRVMFPILDSNGRVIAFGGRVMGDALPKYLNSPETDIFDKSRNLYGLHLARRTRRPYMLLCEGYMDVIALHQAGFDNAIASLGTAFTGLQANLLVRYTKEVVITYDSDGAGQKAALRAIPILKEAGIRTKVLNMYPYKDPDEFIKNLGAEEYEKRIEEAMSSFSFEMQVMAASYDQTDPEQKTRFYQEAAKRMLEFTEELERKNYIDAFCREYNVPYEEFRKLVNRYGANAAFAGSGIDIGEKEKPRSGEQRRKTESGAALAQKLLLSWSTEDPTYMERLLQVLTPEDFDEGPYRTVAAMCMEEYKREGSVAPAKMISRFESKEEQNLVADMCSTVLVETMSPEERKRAFADTVIKVKQKSLEEARLRALEANDAKELSRVMLEKKQLTKLHQQLLR